MLFRLPWMLVLAGSALPGQQGQKVVPDHLADRRGNSFLYEPFGYSGFRLQQIVGSAAICKTNAIIGELGFRREVNVGKPVAGRPIAGFQLTIGNARTAVRTMSKRFTENRAGPQTVVFSGTYNLPNQPRVSRPAVGPWNINWKFRNPWVFVAKEGPLLLELRWSGPLWPRFDYGLDAEQEGRGDHFSFGVAGTFSSPGGNRLYGHGLGERLRPGGSLDLHLGGMLKPYPAVACLGFSRVSWGALRLPLDLTVFGAPKNWLYTSLDLVVPVTLQKNNSTIPYYEAWLRLPIPNASLVENLEVFAQAIYRDPPANTLGLVLSQGVAFRIANRVGSRSQALAGAPDAEEGYFVFRSPGAPIVRLGGRFN